MNQRKKSRARKGAWFVAVRGSYLPANWKGWLTYLPFLGYLLFVLTYGWHQTSSNAQAVMFIVPNFVAAGIVMTWIARRTS